MTARLTFLGAAGTVTGARFLVETARTRLLLDCGMFQGARELGERNWEPFPVDAATLAAIVLSHAHLDHSGYLPRLVHDGFAGAVHCSAGTADLLRIVLPDAAHLEEEEAEFRNRTGATRHAPALPLFTAADAERALGLLRLQPFDLAFAVGEGVTATLSPSGHILGASIVVLDTGGRRLVYSGDLGRYGVPVMRDPAGGAVADALVLESTYGDRRHPADDGTELVAIAVRRAVERRGWLLVPAFAVGRTQELLFLLRRLEEEGRIPRLAVYLDSPMAIQATAVYARHPEEHDAETVAAGARPFVPARLHLSSTTADSKRLNDLEGPVIVIAGSGMATGGRVLHHLRHRLPEASATVLFVGYQAAGTRGRSLVDGAARVRIFGEDVAVRATILSTDALSAHADQTDLLRWLGTFSRAPATTWLVHGESAAAEALRDAIHTRLGWTVGVAADGQKIDI